MAQAKLQEKVQELRSETEELKLPSALGTAGSSIKLPSSPKSGSDQVTESKKGRKTVLTLTRNEALKIVEQYGSKTPVHGVAVEGNPKVGTVQVLKQIHCVEGLDAKQEERIGAYQAEILRTLLRDKPKYVFDEGKTKNLLNSESNLWQERVLRHFPDKTLPKNLTPDQRRVLCDVGAVDIYHIFNPEVHIYRTITPEEAKQYQADVKRNPEQHDQIVMDRRERIAIREVMDFLKKHPGEKVVLVYGAAHKWGPEDFPSEIDRQHEYPQILITDWPDLRLNPSQKRLILRKLSPWPELQLEVVKKSVNFPALAIDELETLECFQAALDKMDLSYYQRRDTSYIVRDLKDKPSWQKALIEKAEYIGPGCLGSISDKEVQRAAFKKWTCAEGDTLFVSLDVACLRDSPMLQLEVIKRARELVDWVCPLIAASEGRELAEQKSGTRRVADKIRGNQQFHPERQIEHIKEAKSVPASAFNAIVSEEGQRLALEKLSYENDREREIYHAGFLRAHAVSEAIKELIDKKFANAPKEWNSSEIEIKPLSDAEAIKEEIRALQAVPDKQLEAVKKAKFIPVSLIWQIKTGKANEIALKKLVFAGPNEEFLYDIDEVLMHVSTYKGMLEVAKRMDLPRDSATHVIYYLKERPEIQLEALQHVKELSVDCFSAITTEKGQQLALQKITDFETFRDIDHFLDSAKTPEIRSQLEKKFLDQHPRP